MATASLSVNAGSFNDPQSRPGLAHFLEHMIFMGSEKYPEEDGYNQHVASNGGECNAYTEFEWTNYQFKVAYKGLQKTIDMLASAFLSPKLSPDAVERELDAIESEFQMNYQEDNVR